MIIEFAVENFRSIKSRQVFNMVRAKTAELEVNSFDPSIDGVSPLLCSSAIYGANAAGKSNFIKALDAMQDIVLDSAKNTQSTVCGNLSIRAVRRSCELILHLALNAQISNLLQLRYNQASAKDTARPKLIG